MAQFQIRSRYRNTEMVIEDGVETVGTWNQPQYLIERPDNKFIEKFYVSNVLEGRPDLISQAVYDTPELDWVIIAFNKPSEVLNWPPAGSIIEIPSSDLVYSYL